MQKTQDDLYDEALSHYFQAKCWEELTPCTIGRVHVTQFVTTPSGSFVLRLYATHSKLNDIKHEHAIIERLNSLTLSFEFPKIVPTLKGETLIQLSNGQYATLFLRISGTVPERLNPEHWKSTGRATAELLKAFEDVKTEDPFPIVNLDTMLYNFYFIPSTCEKFLEQLKCPPYNQFTEEVDFIIKEIEELERAFAGLKLPVQFIHGDLHVGNLLILDGKISGVVDLEFAKPGWRVMDVGVAISRYEGATDPLVLIDAFASGFCEEGELDEEEVKAIPLMTRLRGVALLRGLISVASTEKNEGMLGFNKALLKVLPKMVIWAKENAENIVQAFESKMKNRLLRKLP